MSAKVDLDEKTVGYLKKMQEASAQAQQQAAQQAAQPYIQRMCGAVDMFVEMQGLQGKWDISADLKSIHRTDLPEAPSIPPAQPNIAQKQPRKKR